MNYEKKARLVVTLYYYLLTYATSTQHYNDSSIAPTNEPNYRALPFLRLARFVYQTAHRDNRDVGSQDLIGELST